jgi:hypothetical protein
MVRAPIRVKAKDPKLRGKVSYGLVGITNKLYDVIVCSKELLKFN